MTAEDTHQGPRSRKAALVDPGVAALIFLLALGWFSQSLDTTFNLRDEGYLLYMSERVAAGEVPHRDFIESYGPGVFSATSIPLAMGSGQILSVRWWIAGLKAIAVVLCFLILRRATPRGASIVGALISMLYWGRASINLNTPNASLYTIPLLMLGLLALMHAARRPTRLRHLIVGLLAGVAILFKQSLGIMGAGGMGLAIVSLGAIDPLHAYERARNGGSLAAPSALESRIAVGLFALCALALLVPTWSFMSLRDYTVHILPIHLLMAIVALSALRLGIVRPVKQILGERVLPFGIGMLLVLGSVALVYASWGAFEDLFFNMFVFPRDLRNYDLPVIIPPASLSVFGLGLCVMLAAPLAGLRGSAGRGIAIGAAGLGLVLLAMFVIPHRSPDLYRLPVIWRTASIFDWLLPSALVLAALVPLAADLQTRKASAGAVRTLLPIAFFQAFLCFQIFPRAGHNVWLSLGALVPLGVVLGHRIVLWAARQRAAPGSRRVALAVCALLPVWLVLPPAATVLAPDEAHASRVPVLLPYARGITVTRKTAREEQLDQVRALVRYLRNAEPRDARLLVLGTEQMLYYTSDRAHLIPERSFLVYSAALRMIPLSGLVRLADGAVVRALDAQPDAIIVERKSARPNSVRRAMPDLDRALRSGFVPVESFGPYTVLRSSERADKTTRP